MEVLRELRRAGKASFYYTEFNLLEMLGKIGRMDYDEERVVVGLSSIGEEFSLVHPTLNGYMKALDLRRKGHRDLIDLLLYATSLTMGLVFLTRDDPLIEFLKAVGEETDSILHERDLLAKYG